MNKLKNGFLSFIILLLGMHVCAKVKVLQKLGQTPGGAGYHVNYDSLSARLIVGCGTSLWIYDMTDPQNPAVIAKKPLLGVVNETDVYGNILFVAATHDGVYALDLTTSTLETIDHFPVGEPGEVQGAYDLYRSGDTLFIASNTRVLRLKYHNSSGFEALPEFGPVSGSFCVTGNSEYIAVGSQGLIWGFVNIYDKSDLSTPLCTWQSDRIKLIQKLRFSDTGNNILFVCGGPRPIELFLKSYLFALQITGAAITCIDTATVNGLPVVAQANVMNLDIRHDTLYVATGCAIDLNMGFPLSYVPVLDASPLPSGPMQRIGFINPGLWHFDVALMEGTPYLATSSEWLGVAINNVSGLVPLDTLLMIETGGWSQSCKENGDTLWVAHEGWGLAAYNIDSLMYSAGSLSDSRILHLYSQRHHYFVPDFEFVQDSLLVLASGHVFNLKPWWEGGRPDSVYHLNFHFANTVQKIQTNTGVRIIAGCEILLYGFGNKTMALFDPLVPAGENLDELQINNDPNAIDVQDNRVFFGARYDSTGNDYYLAVAEVVDDRFCMLDSILLSNGLGDIGSVSVDENMVALARTNVISWMSFQGNHFEYLGSFAKPGMHATDILLKNGLIYVADKMYGMRILDIADVFQGILVAECAGTGGWGSNNFGSESITLGDNGRIYLTDFNAGVIIIEGYDSTLVNIPGNQCLQNIPFIVYPNPADEFFIVAFGNDGKALNSVELSITLLSGQKVFSRPIKKEKVVKVPCSQWENGVYLISVKNDLGQIYTRKVVKANSD